jgi:hypothetical protein
MPATPPRAQPRINVAPSKKSIFVELMEAKDIPKVDRFGWCDAYVTMVPGPSQQFQSSVKKRTKEPKWGEVMEFDLVVPDEIELKLYDWQYSAEDRLLGSCCVPLLDADGNTHWYDVTNGAGVSRGKVALRLSYDSRQFGVSLTGLGLQPHKASHGGHGVMGVDSLLARGLPQVLVLCVQWLERWGLETEGLFRKAAGHVDLKRARHALDSGHDLEMVLNSGDNGDWEYNPETDEKGAGLSGEEGEDGGGSGSRGVRGVQKTQAPPENKVHEVAGLVKLFLRELPMPVVPYGGSPDGDSTAGDSSSYTGGADGEGGDGGCRSELMQACASLKGGAAKDGDGSGDMFVDAVQKVLVAFPPAHRQCLYFLLDFLHKVHQHSGVNKMGASNLGTIFGPSILRAPPHLTLEAQAQEAKLVNETVAQLIKHAPELVPRTAEELEYGYTIQDDNDAEGGVTKGVMAWEDRGTMGAFGGMEEDFEESGGMTEDEWSSFKRELRQGLMLQKHGRWGQSKKKRLLVLCNGDQRLRVNAPGEDRQTAHKGLDVRDISRVLDGCCTDVLRKKSVAVPGACFSIVGRERTFDFECEAEEQAKRLVAGLRRLKKEGRIKAGMSAADDEPLVAAAGGAAVGRAGAGDTDADCDGGAGSASKQERRKSRFGRKKAENGGGA